MKDFPIKVGEGGILTEIALTMIGWSTPPDHSTYKMKNMYLVYSAGDVSSSIKKPDGSKQMGLDSRKVKTIFQTLTTYLTSSGVEYGVLLRMDYSLLFTSEDLETDPLYFKLASGWNILDITSEQKEPELQNLSNSASIDLITINRYLDALRK